MINARTSRVLRGLLGMTALLAVVAMVGCEDDPAPAAPPPAPVEETPPPAPPTPAPEAKADEPAEEYKRPEFPGQVRRDPFIFEPPQRQVTDDKGEDRQREPLELFRLESLKLVAIVTGTAIPKAMFVDSQGFGHIAKEGDRIGTDGGRITDIRSNEVEVTINPQRQLNSDEELENNGTAPNAEGEEQAEPVKIVILLSDTDIELPSEDEDEEDDDIVDRITGDDDDDLAGDDGGDSAP